MRLGQNSAGNGGQTRTDMHLGTAASGQAADADAAIFANHGDMRLGRRKSHPVAGMKIRGLGEWGCKLDASTGGELVGIGCDFLNLETVVHYGFFQIDSHLGIAGISAIHGLEQMNFTEMIVLCSQCFLQNLQSRKQEGDIRFLAVDITIISQIGSIFSLFCRGPIPLLQGIGHMPPDLWIGIVFEGNAFLVVGDG